MQTITDVKNEVTLIIKEWGEDPAEYDIDKIVDVAAYETGDGYALDEGLFWPAVCDAMVAF